jgi:hydroxymethylglutaryl-CoA synthase
MIGIVGYGVYVPRYRIKTEEIANMWGRDVNSVKNGLLIDEKSLPSMDEDTVTMSVEASLNAIKRAKIDPKDIGAIYCGSESPVYAVKPNITIISNAIGMSKNHTGADVEFACKAGTAAMQMVMGLVKSDMIKYGLAIGSDTAEYYVENVGDQSTSAGSGAFILGKNKNEIIAEIEETLSYSSDIPDFWRRPRVRYPTHAERFTGEPAYFKHTITATKLIMEKVGVNPSDIDHVAFHTPNGKFATRVAKMLGFTKEQIKAGFVVNKIGNTYSAASLIGLSSILDVAKPGQKIIVTSFGSGAGSDAFYIKVSDKIEEKRNLAKTTKGYIDKKKYVDYSTYCKFTGRIE